MKGRQRQVCEAVAADRAPQFSFLPLISASGLLFVFTRQFGNVRGYHICNGSRKKKKNTSPLKTHRGAMRAACTQTQTLPWDSRFTLWCLIWSWDVGKFYPAVFHLLHPRLWFVLRSPHMYIVIAPTQRNKLCGEYFNTYVYPRLVGVVLLVWILQLLTGVLLLWQRASVWAVPQDSVLPDSEQGGNVMEEGLPLWRCGGGQ